MKLIFEQSADGRGCDILPNCDVEIYQFSDALLREQGLYLPEIAEIDISRHYTNLAKHTHGVNDGFYPLGSCTMKYNPTINEDIASLDGFAKIHPLQPTSTVQGCLEVLTLAEKYLGEITGMDAMTFQPGAGAHGEFTGVLLIKSYHAARNDSKRNKIIVPDAAHGTNPATATMTNYEVINIPSTVDGFVDLEKLREAVGDDTAGLMLTNPNTIGIFEGNILEVTKIVHDAGGLVYYDGANLNAVMGQVRPGDMGFDVIHLNLHKTFSTPHGGGGPGSGAVGCKKFLAEFLPNGHAVEKNGEFHLETPSSTIGSVKAFYGNFLVDVRALSYILTLGSEGISEASENAVLNANYMKHLLSDVYDIAFEGICMHEFVITLAKMKKEKDVSAMDIAKMLIDYGMHPPTMYFPLIVPEALMVEPTETESKTSLEEAARVYKEVYLKAIEDPEAAHQAPVNAYVRRLDEVGAARNPRLRYEFDSLK